PLDFEFVSASFPKATVHLVFFLTAVKLLTAKTDRDYAYLKTLAVMELLGGAMLSVDMSFFAFLALFLFFAIGTLAAGEMRRSMSLRGTSDGTPRAAPIASARKPLGRRLSVVSFVLFAGILTMTAGMFFVLPRTARAALSRFMPQRYHLPGFTDEVTLGEIGKIQQSSRPIMHIQNEDGANLIRTYWRGAALTQFDGKRWFNPPAAEKRLFVEGGVLTLRTPSSRPGRSVRYKVELEDLAGDTLFIAGKPQLIGIGLPALWLSSGGAFRVPRRLSGVEYSVDSFIEDERAPVIAPPRPLTPEEREETLMLPELDPRIPQLALSMTEGARSDEQKARLLEMRLRRNYGYTLQLLSKPVPDPLAYFLFVRKKGHCEYFASAMAVMLRTLGIPSRVVAGFQSGVMNPITGSQVVRASDAHSWVEAWIPRRGWTTFDPTPSAPYSSSASFSSRVSMFFDAADQFWENWVLSYDLQHQALLAARMQQSGDKLSVPFLAHAASWWKRVSRHAGTAGLAILLSLAVFGIALKRYGSATARWWIRFRGERRAQRGEAQISDATLLYRQMLSLLARRGFQKPPWLTPSEFAGVLPASEMSVLVDDLTSAYNDFRFGGRRDVAPRMVRLLALLETEVRSR
ncbi:MAG TPA: DUF3488 and transglutaminase-like domain-containing protein, partial [Bryobacteraceae bacterium]|nr:DUF3488 and transglutaminase-like domain-containing protein [Bryobacteraceae bacterium]